MRPEAQAWLEQARADMEASERSLDSGTYYLAAFCAHQVAEKALKGTLIERTRHLPSKTHTLQTLWRDLGEPGEIDEDLRLLNPHYTVARYPDAANGVPAHNYTRAIAAPLVEAARRVLGWVTSGLTGAG